MKMTTTVSRSIEYLKPLIDSHFAKSQSTPFIVGISGPQGSGKSYLSSHLSQKLSLLYPHLTTIDISTDDFYLTFDDQQHLQRTHKDNWIVSGRGPPSTHDLNLLKETLDAVKSGNDDLLIPRYDKSAIDGKGDRFPLEKWTQVHKRIDILIVEGWFNGFKSLPDDELISHWQKIILETGQHGEKFNKLVHNSDIGFINDSLREYESVWDTFDFFIYLSTNDLQNVYKWRLDQEHSLKSSNGGLGMTDDEVVKFVDRYMPCYMLYYKKMNDNGCLSQRNKNLKLAIDTDRNLINSELI